MDRSNPKISVTYAGQAAIVTFALEKILEEADIRGLEASIMPLIDQDEHTNLVLDFSRVKFLTSSVLGLLIRISKKVYEADGKLRLCGIGRNILEIFKITRLDRVFEIREDVAESLQGMV